MVSQSITGSQTYFSLYKFSAKQRYLETLGGQCFRPSSLCYPVLTCKQTLLLRIRCISSSTPRSQKWLFLCSNMFWSTCLLELRTGSQMLSAEQMIDSKIQAHPASVLHKLKTAEEILHAQADCIEGSSSISSHSVPVGYIIIHCFYSWLEAQHLSWTST